MQMFKHLLLRRYLQAWFPILGSAGARLLYVETHAGKGKHLGGEAGSPLVALQTFKEHARASTVLGRCDVVFHLVELNSEHVAALREAIEEESFPVGIRVIVEKGDFADQLTESLRKYKGSNSKVPPMFVFIDPFNYNIPVQFLHQILKSESSEAMVTFMAQDVVTAMRDAARGSTGKADLLDKLYGGAVWRTVLEKHDFKEQLDEAIRAYASAVGAIWSTTMRMQGSREYALIHFTNSFRGRDEMKRAMWAVTGIANKPGEFVLSTADDPSNGSLLELQPDLSPLISSFKSAFMNRRVNRTQLEAWCRPTNFLDRHMHEIIRDGLSEDWIDKHFNGPIGPSMGEITVREKSQGGLF
jgi:three-Cys-motif partner protein